MKAYNSSGGSDYSNEANAITVKPPSNLIANAVSSSRIDLTWRDNSLKESGYKIERKIPGSWTEIGTVSANVTSFSNTGLTPNKIYYYRVRANNGLNYSGYSNVARDTTFSGDILPKDITETDLIPDKYSISQNYPNPFNPETTIKYALPVESDVSIKIYDNLGKEIETLVNGRKEAGYHSIIWNAKEVPSGIYFYKMIAGNGKEKFIKVKKLMIMK